jgi:uncharacterized damage-inducible protein DinB
MNEATRIADQTKRAWEGEAWHGPSLQEAVSDVTAEEAAARPIPSVHTILEIVLHVTAWADIVRRRVEGEDVGTISDTEDWPAASEGKPSSWDEARRRLGDAHGRLIETIGGLDPRLLDERPPGSRSSRYATLHGAIQHGLYHAGQIAVLKKAVREGR